MAQHRGHNEGTISKRVIGRKDGTKTVRYIALAPIDAQGKRPSLGSFGTVKEARAALDEHKVASAMGFTITGKTPTLKEWFDAWLESRTKIAHTTRVDYTTSLGTMATYIGHIPLDKLAAAHIAVMWDKLEAGIAADGQNRKPLTVTTLHKLHIHLKAALGAAVDEDTVSLARNVARKEAAHPGNGERKSINPLSKDEAAALLAATKDTPDHALWTVLLTTGCRLGEGLALHWQDIDWERGRISICGSLYYVAGQGWKIGPTKTRKNRVVELRPGTLAALRSHRARQLEMRLAAGPDWQDGDYVFADGVGKPLVQLQVRRRFHRACDAADIARRSPKELRHTFATLGLLNNVPAKIVSEALGHAKVGMTLDIYSHVIPGMMAASMSHLDSLFG